MIDILLATYNGKAYLEEQISSLLRQSYADIRIIARDDGSTDRTVELLQKFAGADPGRVRLVSGNPSGGARNNFFTLLGHSDAEYTMFCDQDDVWLFDKVEHTLREMKKAEEAYFDTPILVHTDLSVVDEALTQVAPSFFHMQRLDGEYKTLNRLVAQNNITGCTVMINRKLRELVRTSDGALMHDWWIGLVAAALGKVVFLPEQTMLYRQHRGNEIGAKDAGSAAYVVKKAGDKEGMRRSILAAYGQAKAFLEVYGDRLSEPQKKMLDAYAGAGKENMWNRFVILQKYHCFKSGISRKVGQIIYG